MCKFHKVDKDGWFVFDLGDGFSVSYDPVKDKIDESEWMSPLQHYGPNEDEVYWNENTTSFLEELLHDCQQAFAKLCFEWEAACSWPQKA